MNSPNVRKRPARVTLAAGLAFAPGTMAAAEQPPRHVAGTFDIVLVVVVGLAVGLLAWAILRRIRARLEQYAATRIRQMTALIEHADCLLWEAEVELGPADLVWRMTLHNSAFCRKLFHGRPQTPGIDLWWQFKIDDREAMNQRCREALANGRPGYAQEFRAVREGQVLWMHENVSITPLGPNRFWLVGLVTDITAQREAEAATRQSELTVDRILAHAQCLLWRATVILEDGELKWPHFDIPHSQFSELLFGDRVFSRDRGFWDTLNVPEQREMDERSTRAILDGAAGYAQQFRAINRAGRVFWLHERVSITRVSTTVWSLVGVVTDITGQNEAEAALAAEKERLAVTFRAMKECVITTDIAGLIQFMNPAAAKLTEWGEKEAQGCPIGDICRLQNSRSDQPVEVPITRVARGDTVADLSAHTRLITRSGGHRQIEGCCAPIHAADSRVIGTVLVFRDVTEQERLEQELIRATRLESVGVLAGGIAHDFNNILTAVMGNLALAQLDITPASPAGASLRSAEKAALRARDLTQQLLTFAKGGEPVRAAVQLEAIVREMAAFALHGSQVKAFYDMAPDLWPADADKGQIGRVVQNLVINAVQAMPAGGTLRIMARNDSHDDQSQPSLAPGDYIQIAIADTGEGIKPEHLARIFDPYFTTKQTGTGLGLAAVYSIVKKHLGHVEVESQLGQGTTFRIWLPALRQQSVPADTRTPWRVPGRLKGRVLFMDDEQIIRDMAVTLLQRFGLAVDCAIDGTETVEKYRAAFAAGLRYDLVIMDLTVPGGMGGLAALGRLREVDSTVKAVVSSGYSSDPVLANHLTHGFAAVIAKPYEIDELSRVLREVLPDA